MQCHGLGDARRKTSVGTEFRSQQDCRRKSDHLSSRRNFIYYVAAGIGIREEDKTKYACLGTGFTGIWQAPVLYEGINEKGLAGGQLYYRGFARYESACKSGTRKLQPPFVVLHLLAQCGTVKEAVEMIEEKITLMDTKLLGTVPPLHWAFCDRTGEMAVLEPEGNGVRIYRSTIGIMTNSPGYEWHRINLLNYAGCGSGL